MRKIGWGIVGPGSIAKRFLHDLPRCEGARLRAVASRTLDKAASFGESYGFERHYGSYEELFADDQVDIVYVAVPHPFHEAVAIEAMKHKKAVLCEKPVSVNAESARRMIDCAKENQVFFMEAMWTRFFPVQQKIQKSLKDGSFGKPILLQADFSFGNWDILKSESLNGRLFEAELAGGSLLDIGIYCISYASFIRQATRNGPGGSDETEERC